MKNFVKIKGHPNWFLEIKPEDPTDYEFLNKAHENRLKDIGEDYFYRDFSNKILQDEAIRRVKFAATNFCDYFEKARKYQCPVYVRQNGSFAIFDPEQVTERRVWKGFPTGGAEIAICENSKEPEPFWVEYLQSRFPNKTIKTIPYFSSKSRDEIKEAFEGVEYVTFSTTFTRYDWFENAILMAGERKIIGYCHSQGAWGKAIEIADSANKNIEIIDL